VSGNAKNENFDVEAGKSFRGWLPTITGRLSFSIFGQTSYPTKTRCANVADEHSRYLVIVQRRDTGDAILHSSIKFFLRTFGFMDDDTDLRFVLIANTKHKELLKTQEYLQGKAYIIDRKGLNRPGISGGSNSEVDWSHDEQDNEQI
jgi:hypothetical protein